MDALMERTLVVIKPDGVQRGLCGEIIARFERAGIKILGMKMIWVDKAHVEKHYPESRIELIRTIGNKTLESYSKQGKDVIAELGTDDPMKIGTMVNRWNMEYLSSGPVLAMVLEGIHAIENVRMITGNTFPTLATPGTIRGDYSIDSPILANVRKRPVRNLMHASGTKEEANYEIALWFRNGELHTYKRADEEVMFGSEV